MCISKADGPDFFPYAALDLFIYDQLAETSFVLFAVSICN